MKKYILLILIIFFIKNIQAQFTPKWVESSTGVRPYGEGGLKKAILFNDTVYIVNKNMDSLITLSIKQKEIDSFLLPDNKNFLGMPFIIKEGKYYNLYTNKLDIFRGAGLGMPGKLKYSNLTPVDKFCDDLYWGKRNSLLNVTSKNTQSADYLSLLFIDFFIQNNVFNLFIRDNYRLTWWQYKGDITNTEDIYKWKEIKTYTYMDSTSILFHGEKSGERSGILIHTGVDYNHSTGCLLTCGASYTTSTEIMLDNDTGETYTVTIYNTNGTSTTTLNAINTYIEQKKQEAEDNNKTLKITIEINR